MHDSLKEVITLMSMVGVPSLFAMSVWCIRFCLKYATQIKILARAQQAQMRTQLIQQYHTHMANGYISEEDMEEWENQYQAYHELGKNGVLDARRTTLLALHSTPNT